LSHGQGVRSQFPSLPYRPRAHQDMLRRASTLALLLAAAALVDAQTGSSYYYGEAMEDKLDDLNGPSAESTSTTAASTTADVDLLSDFAAWGPGVAKRCPVHGPFEITAAEGGGVTFKPHPRKWSSAVTEVSGLGDSDGIWLKYSGIEADRKWELVARTEERRSRFVHPLHDLHKQPDANGVFIPWTSFVGQATSIGKVTNDPSKKLAPESVRSIGFIRHNRARRGRMAADKRHSLTVTAFKVTKENVAVAAQAAVLGKEAPKESKYSASVTV